MITKKRNFSTQYRLLTEHKDDDTGKGKEKLLYNSDSAMDSSSESDKSEKSTFLDKGKELEDLRDDETI